MKEFFIPIFFCSFSTKIDKYTGKKKIKRLSASTIFILNTNTKFGIIKVFNIVFNSNIFSTFHVSKSCNISDLILTAD